MRKKNEDFLQIGKSERERTIRTLGAESHILHYAATVPLAELRSHSAKRSRVRLSSEPP